MGRSILHLNPRILTQNRFELCNHDQRAWLRWVLPVYGNVLDCSLKFLSEKLCELSRSDAGHIDPFRKSSPSGDIILSFPEISKSINAYGDRTILFHTRLSYTLALQFPIEFRIRHFFLSYLINQNLIVIKFECFFASIS